MNTQEIFQQRLQRIMGQIALQKTDRTPVLILNDIFAPKHMGVKMSDYVADMWLASRTMLQSAIELGTDAVQMTTFHPMVLSTAWLSKVELPGRELPEDSLWQVHEAEVMKPEDYDVILSKGWNAFFYDCLKNRLGDPMAELMPWFQIIPGTIKNFIDAGIVPLSGGNVTPPFEAVCGGRSMTNFIRDMMRQPDKVQAVFDVAMEDIIADAKTLLAAKPLGVWVGGWRSAPNLFSPKMWERFEWPYMKRLVELVIEAGVVPILHLDSDWERALPYFKEFPADKCLFYPDYSTNIYKIKEVLGDRMCINGDVPATLLTLGTPDDVYNYSTKLIRDIGPTGFILGQACDIPYDAKVENVKAMISAAQ